MNNPEQHDDWNDDKLEMSNLDPEVGGFSAVSNKLLSQFRRNIRRSPRFRATSIGLTSLLCLLVLFLVLRPYLPFAARQTTRQSGSLATSSAPSSSLINAVMNNGVVYINGEDGTLTAYRAGDGTSLWHQRLDSSGSLVATNSALYRFTSTVSYGNIEALRTSDGSLLWKQRVPLGGTLPLIVQDGIVYFNSHDGVIYALQANDGRILWHFMSGLSGPFDGFFSASVGIASILTVDRMVYLLRASDGSPIYHFPAPSNQDYWWAPAIDNGIFYVDTGSTSVEARSIRDGSLLWQYQVQSSGLWPAIAASGIVYISMPGGAIKALRGENGMLLWQYGAKAVINPPVVYNQLAYLTTRDGEVVAVQTSNGTAPWHWRPSTPPEDSISLLTVADGIVYINLDTADPMIYALQAFSGEILWHHVLSANLPNYVATISDGILYIASSTNAIEAWRASDGQFLWRYTSPAPLAWYPQVDNGILLIRSFNGTLDVLGLDDGKLLWHYP